ncbi:hypothetical protein LTR17_017911 [Elasticomyces elasticus]|nr:hypothetical protein LTR17_017911 [Elasticomyces elasticus]
MMDDDAELQEIEATDAEVSARTRIFDTTELLEHILLHTPARDVLLAQRVSQRWQAVIKTSLHLQRLLLFTAGEAIDPLQWAVQNLPPPSSGIPWFQDDDDVLCKVHNQRPDCDIVGFIMDGTMCFHLDQLLAKVFNDDELTVRQRNVNLNYTHRTCELHDSARRPEASWRRMLFQSPGVEGNIVVTGLTGIWVSRKVRSDVLSAARSSEREGCIRLGRLWDASVEATRIRDEEISHW